MFFSYIIISIRYLKLSLSIIVYLSTLWSLICMCIYLPKSPKIFLDEILFFFYNNLFLQFSFYFLFFYFSCSYSNYPRTFANRSKIILSPIIPSKCFISPSIHVPTFSFHRAVRRGKKISRIFSQEETEIGRKWSVAKRGGTGRRVEGEFLSFPSMSSRAGSCSSGFEHVLPPRARIEGPGQIERASVGRFVGW